MHTVKPENAVFGLLTPSGSTRSADFTEYLLPNVIGRTHLCDAPKGPELYHENYGFVTEVSFFPPKAAPVLPLPTAHPASPETIERVRRARSIQAIVARTPKSVEVTKGYITTYFVEALACGHKFIAYPQAHSLKAKRRNCWTCAEKFLAQSASLRKKAA